MTRLFTLLTAVTVSLVIMSCAGGTNGDGATTALALVDPEPGPTQETETFQSTMMGANEESGRNCRVQNQGDGTKMVTSEDNDWYLYVKESNKVDCAGYGGAMTVDDDGLYLRLAPLYPLDDAADPAQKIRELLAEELKRAARDKYKLDSTPGFKAMNLGDAHRPALCAQSTSADSGRFFVACVTAAKNANGEILAETVVRHGKGSDMEAVFTEVASISVSWYRNSDTDGNGTLVNIW